MNPTTIEIVQNEQLSTVEKIQALDKLIKLDENSRSLDLTDDIGNTALHYAAYSNEPLIVAKLLELGASVKIQNNEGEIPLHCAVSSRKENTNNIIILLCEHGSDSNHNSQAGTPLTCAIDTNHNLNPIQQMKGVDVVASLINSSKNIDVNMPTSVPFVFAPYNYGLKAITLKQIKSLSEEDVELIMTGDVKAQDFDDMRTIINALNKLASEQEKRDFLNYLRKKLTLITPKIKIKALRLIFY